MFLFGAILKMFCQNFEVLMRSVHEQWLNMFWHAWQGCKTTLLWYHYNSFTMLFVCINIYQDNICLKETFIFWANNTFKDTEVKVICLHAEVCILRFTHYKREVMCFVHWNRKFFQESHTFVLDNNPDWNSVYFSSVFLNSWTVKLTV